MFDESKICPYTGLRPFTEDESIYFKGRDEHIEQATRQLEKNKFIMLTGASGDGKSSLVYAGIVPNAKAGFLKSTFSNWAVADFRPERSPMANLSRSLASQLNINEDTVRTELSYGFSALIDIYKASPLYYDTRGIEWLEEDDKSRAVKKRKAANLIILADQFEEFYTNPENFKKGVPSQEAMSVTNLLLETARIALEENLPVYVIITMRSDFIGQCAAFRGLPEYIGFSQFFVPRLNRKELREVIEEPAVLSGNAINRRLTERLINDIVDGTDQLPILQHALNQIWKMADEGGSEMDLLHYAMVGGMPGDELSTEDAAKFRKWFSDLPAKIQSCYNRPGLQNVLNTHANKLYNQASDHVQAMKGEGMNDDEAKRIIQITFKCLTKIDNSRAVRNRMTLGEVTAIINDPQLDYRKVGSVLEIFRQPGNTLLKPYSEETEVLKEDDILDITHESLIRNWNNLKKWADEEFASYTISVDFGRQLNRWMESGKSDDFLLYIGPLTYFEGWINKVRPNAAWAARYMKSDLDRSQKLEKAKQVQANANEFLKRSSRKHLITRTVIRFGPKKIAAILGAVVVLTFSSFMLKNYLTRQNSYVLGDIKETTLQKLVANPNVPLRSRTSLVTEEMRLGEVNVMEVVRSVQDPIEKINVITSLATQLIYQGATHEPEQEILRSLTVSDSLLSAYPISDKNMARVSLVFKEMNDLRETLELAYFYNPSVAIDSLRARQAKRSATWVMHILREQPEALTDINNFNVAMEHGINKKAFSPAEIDEIVGQLSSFDNPNVSAWVSSSYNRDKLSSKGFNNYGFKFNGLYQELAYLYGVKGNADKALQAIDTLLLYNQNYFQNDYTAMADNASHIAACFYRYGKLDELDKFVSGYCQRKKITEADFYAHLLARCKLYEFATTVLDLDPQYDLQFNLSLEYSEDKLLDFFFAKYREVLNSTVADPQERNFNLALSYKDEAIIHLRKLEVAGLDSLGKPYLTLFDKAVELYKGVDPGYLNQEIQMIELSGNDVMVQPRKFLFLYPDVRTPFHPNEPRLYHYFFVSGCFLQYIIDKDLFKSFYHEGPELHYFETFMRDYHFVERQIAYTVSKKMSYELLVSLEKNLSALHADKYANLSYLYLYLGHEAAKRNEKETSLGYYNKLTREGVKALFLNSLNPAFTFQLISFAVSDLTMFDHLPEADKLAKGFGYTVNRSTLYACAAHNLLYQGIKDSRPDKLIDSAMAEIIRTKGLTGVQTNRIQVAYALAMRNRANDLSDAYKIIKNVEFKYNGIELICRGLARNGKLYEATQHVPENLSDADAFTFAWKMVVGYGDFVKPESRAEWNEFADNRLWFLNNPIVYVNEN